MLSKIGSVYGKPLYCDKCTVLKMKMRFARILVEMNFFRDVPEMIELVDEQGVVFQQKVIYEWKPIICSKCRNFGHLQQDCRVGQLGKEVWKVKRQAGVAVEAGRAKNQDNLVTQNIKDGPDNIYVQSGSLNK